jgi:peptidoglycan hydrolase-like protein with peptidoglycan-binding domain
MSTFAAFERAGTRCLKAQPGATALMKWIIDSREERGWASARNWGIYNCRTIAGTVQRSTHAEGRGLDIGFPLVNGKANPQGTRLVNFLRANASRLGIQTIIWNRTIWSRRNPNGVPYLGKHPHTDHVHLELSWATARSLTLSTIRAIAGAVAKVTTSSTSLPRPSASRVVEAARAAPRRWLHLADVRLLQRRLVGVGHNPGSIDGRYGSATRASVLAYQRRFPALTNDGLAGTATINHLWR